MLVRDKKGVAIKQIRYLATEGNYNFGTKKWYGKIFTNNKGKTINTHEQHRKDYVNWMKWLKTISKL